MEKKEENQKIIVDTVKFTESVLTELNPHLITKAEFDSYNEWINGDSSNFTPNEAFKMGVISVGLCLKEMFNKSIIKDGE